MRIGVDLGGTKIEAIALADGGRELARRRIASPVESVRGTVAAIAGLVQELEEELGATGSVGIGTPGAISPASGLMKNSNSTWLNGQPLDKALADALGRPVRLANDANCFALSEATDGAAAGASVVFGAILGTGVGGGVVVDGRVLGGRHAIGGEWGHNPLPWPMDDERPGPLCYCGQRGCLETFVSGTGLAADYQRATGRSCTAEAIAASAGTSAVADVDVDVDTAANADTDADADAERAIARYEHRLARALATVINLLDPDAIVLGGGVSNIDRLYRNVPATWADYVFSDHVDTPLLKAAHGDSSGVRGAAWLWPAATPPPR